MVKLAEVHVQLNLTHPHSPYLTLHHPVTPCTTVSRRLVLKHSHHPKRQGESDKSDTITQRGCSYVPEVRHAFP
jgi:hypothetical protein